MHPLRFISAEMHPYKRHYDRVWLDKHFVQTFLPLATGHWSLVTGHWPLATGHWPLTTGHWPLATGPWPLYFPYRHTPSWQGGATHFLRIYFSYCFKSKVPYAFSTHFLRIFLRICLRIFYAFVLSIVFIGLRCKTRTSTYVT